MANPLARAAAAAVNHVLAPADWAREALRQHAGAIAVFELPPLVLALAVMPDGQVAAAAQEAEPDVRIALTPGAAVRLAVGDASASQLARLEGDAAFGATLRHLFQNLRWDFEEDLSRFTGDIAAHRLSLLLRALARAPREAAGRMGAAAAEYATEEARVLPPRAEIEAWLAEVDRLRDDAARLEARLQRLERGAGD